MTAAKQLEMKGMQKGMQQGMHTRGLEIARNMLSEGFAANVIRKLAGLSMEELMKLQEEAKKEV